MNKLVNKIIHPLLILILLFCFVSPFINPAPAHAVVERHWVQVAGSGTGNWNDTAHWDEHSGGAGGDSVPDSGTSVHFDSNSFSGAGQVVTVNVAASCLDMDWTGATNTPTLTVTNLLTLSGSAIFIAAMVCNGANSIIMSGSGTSITTNGLQVNCTRLILNSVGTFTLNDNFITGGSTILGLYRTTLDTNGKTVTVGTIYDNGQTYAKTLTTGGSTINCSSFVFTGSGALTLSDTTGTINVSGTGAFGTVATSVGSFGTVNLNGTAHTISGSNTFVNLYRTGTATKTDTLTLTSGTTQTVTGECGLSGNSATNRLLVQSSTVGTAATINLSAGGKCRTSAGVATQNVDIMDITMSNGAANERDLSAITGLSGDCQGNTGITFTTADTETWDVDANGDWDTVGNWDGAVAADRVPLPQDDVSLNFAFTGVRTIQMDMPRLGHNITTAGAANTPVLASVITTSFYGSYNQTGVNATSTANLIACGRATGMPVGGWTLTFGGVSIYRFTQNAYGGTYTLQDALTVTSANYLVINAGTLDFNDQNVTAQFLNMGGGSDAKLYMGSGTTTLNGTTAGFSVSISSSAVIYPETSTLRITNSTNNGKPLSASLPAKNLNNVIIEGTGDYVLTISGNWVFNTFTVDRSAAAKTVTVTQATTQTFNSMVCATSGITAFTINSTGTPANFVSTGGTDIAMDYLNLSNNAASPANIWHYMTNSTIGAGVSGWEDGTPHVTVQAASSVEETTATLNGNITDLNYGGNATVRGFEYDVDSGAPYALDIHSHGSFGTGAFTEAPAGLTKGELYYYRAYATNPINTAYSPTEETFLTKPDEPTALTVVVNGTGSLKLDWTMGTGAQQTMVRYRTDGVYPTDPANGTLAYQGIPNTYTHNGLTGGTTYHYRTWSYATEGGLTQYSDLYSSDNEMAIEIPTLTTQAASLVEETTATLNGTITVTGGVNSTTRGFQYDTDSGAPYASDTHTNGSYGVGAYTANLIGLTRGERYYYRAYATNTQGSGYGGEQSFLTKPEAPTGMTLTPGIQKIAVTWIKGTGSVRTMVRYKLGSYPANIADGTQVYYGTGTSVTATGLANTTDYYFRAWGEVTDGALQQYSDGNLSGMATTTADFGANSASPLLLAIPPIIALVGCLAIYQMQKDNPYLWIELLMLIILCGILMAFIAGLLD